MVKPVKPMIGDFVKVGYQSVTQIPAGLLLPSEYEEMIWTEGTVTRILSDSSEFRFIVKEDSGYWTLNHIAEHGYTPCSCGNRAIYMDYLCVKCRLEIGDRRI